MATLPIEFYEELPFRTEEDLYNMIGHKDGYMPEAIKLAKEELRKRNLYVPERIAQLEAQVLSETKIKDSIDQTKANVKLSWLLRIVFFIIGGAPLLLVMYYERKGYKRKANECWTIFLIWLAVLIVSFISKM